MKKQNLLHTVSTAMMAIVAYVMTASSVMAHPGHDHGANESMLMHVLFYGSIIAAVAVAAWFIYRQLNKQNSK